MNTAKHVREANETTERGNVVQFPTAARAAELRAQGKVIVHKPAELQRFVERSDDDTFPDDAA